MTRYFEPLSHTIPRALKDHDKIEYLVVTFDDENRKVRLSLRQADILRALAADEELIKAGGGVPEVNVVKKT